MKHIVVILSLILVHFFIADVLVSPESSYTFSFIFLGGFALVIYSLQKFLEKFSIIRLIPIVVVPLLFALYQKQGAMHLGSAFKQLEMVLLSFLTIFSAISYKAKFDSRTFTDDLFQLLIRFFGTWMILGVLSFLVYDIAPLEEFSRLSSHELFYISLFLVLPAPILSFGVYGSKEHVFFEKVQHFRSTHLLILVVGLPLVLLTDSLDSALVFLWHTLLGFGIFFAVKLYHQFTKNDFILFLIGLIFALLYFGLIETHFDCFVVFFVVGFFIQTSKPLYSQIKTYANRYTSIIMLFFSVIFFNSIELKAEKFLLASFLYLLALSVSYLSKKGVHQLFAKTKDEHVYITGIQGVFSLFLIEFLNSNGIVTGEFYGLLQSLVVLHLIFGSVVLQLLSFFHKEKVEEMETIELDLVDDRMFKQFPIGLDDPKLKLRLKTLSDEFNVLSIDFVESYLSSSLEPGKVFIDEINETYQQTLNKLHKELEYVGSEDKNLLKEKIRENRSQLAHSYLKLIKHYQSDETLNNQLLLLNKNYITNLQEIFLKLKAIEIAQNDANLMRQDGDSFFVQIIKFLKRSYLMGFQLVSKSYKLRRTIYLKDIFLFRFYDVFPFVGRLFVNKVLYQHFLILRKSYVLFKAMNDHFIQLIEYIDHHFEDEEFSSQLDYVSTQLNREVNEEYHIIQKDFGSFIEQDSQILRRGFNHLMKHAYTDLEVAGTFENWFHERRPSKSYRKYEDYFTDIQDLHKNWMNLYSSKVGHLSMELEITRLQNQIRKIVNSAIHRFSEQINTYIRAIILSTSAQRDLLLEQINERVASKVDIDQKFLNEIKRKFLYQIKINTQKSIETLKYSKKLSSFISELIEQIHQVINGIPNTFLIGLSDQYEISDGMYPKLVNLEHAPFREITRSFLEVEVTRSLTELNSQITVGLDNLHQIFSEIATVISTDIDRITETYLNGSHSNEDVVNELKARFDIYKIRFTESVEYTDSILTNVNTTIVKEVVEKIHKIRELTIEATDRTLRQSIDTYTMEDKPLADFFLQVASKYSSQLNATTQKLYYQIRIRFSLLFHQLVDEEEYTNAHLIRDIDRLDSDATLAKLPFVYQKLLSLEPVEIKDFLIGREHEIKLVNAGYERWKQGLNSNLALVGKMGSGKTSFVNYMIKHHFKNETIYHVKISFVTLSEAEFVKLLAKPLGFQSGVTTLDELRDHILLREHRVMVVVESLHRIFAKTIDGFELLRSFLSFMNDTSKYVFWVHSYAKMSWEYLKNVMSIHESYPFIIELKPLSSEDIVKIIQTRNKVSGFSFIFPEAVEKKSLFKMSENGEKKVYNEKEFYLSLSKASRGNVFTALYLWLESLSDFKRTEVHVNPVRAFSYRILEHLSDDKVFTLLSMLQMGGITLGLHQKIFNQGAVQSKVTLDYLEHINLIKLNNAELKSYAVNKVAYSIIEDELKRRKLLYV